MFFIIFVAYSFSSVMTIGVIVVQVIIVEIVCSCYLFMWISTYFARVNTCPLFCLLLDLNCLKASLLINALLVIFNCAYVTFYSYRVLLLQLILKMHAIVVG